MVNSEYLETRMSQTVVCSHNKLMRFSSRTETEIPGLSTPNHPFVAITSKYSEETCVVPSVARL